MRQTRDSRKTTPLKKRIRRKTAGGNTPDPSDIPGGLLGRGTEMTEGIARAQLRRTIGASLKGSHTNGRRKYRSPA